GYTNLGLLRYGQGRWPEAVECYERADVIRQEYGFVAERAMNLHNRALVSMAMGDHAQARKDLETCLEINHLVGNNTGIGKAHIELADLAALQGRMDEAASHLQAVQAEKDALDEYYLIRLHCLQALVHADRGDMEPAFVVAGEALEMALALELGEEEAECCRV